MNVGDTVILNEVLYGEPKKYEIMAVQHQAGENRQLVKIFIIESEDGERLARFENQLLKVE